MKLNYADARHLLLRTGFGAKQSRIHQFMSLNRREAVDHLLNSVSHQTDIDTPRWADETPPPGRIRRNWSAQEKKRFRKKIRKRAIGLQKWWLQQMLYSENDFNEKLTLFWHNHFTSGFRKVRWPGFLLKQHFLHRRYLLGNFADYLNHIAKDPAMLIYLDGVSNNKDHPNENFARELLELFTLGTGHYTERDIREAARAFTGWKINRNKGAYRFAHRKHDTGLKTFLGNTGRFKGEDIIAIVLKQEQVAQHISEKFWREFVSPDVDPKQIKRIATAFRDSNYHLKTLMQELLLSDAFWDPASRGVLIKSPVELMMGTARYLDLSIKDWRPLQNVLRRLGQDLFNPPNVKGWPGGKRWISAGTLLLRNASLQRLMRNVEIMDPSHGHKNHQTMADLSMSETNKSAMRGNKSMQMDAHIPADFMQGLCGKDQSNKVLQSVLLALEDEQSLSDLTDIKDELERITQILLNPIYQLK